MIEQAIVASRDWPWAGPLFVYSLRDRARAAADDIEDHFGLLRVDGDPKPAAAIVRSLADVG